MFDTCNSSGDNSTDAACLSFYDSCVGASSAGNSTIDCVAQQEKMYLSGANDQDIDSSNAQCKDMCSREFVP